MPNKHGDFIWYELLTEDADGAQKFYGDLLGWETEDGTMSEIEYRLFKARDAETGQMHYVGGMLQLTAEMKAGGARPVWLGYVAVDDVDATLDKLVAAGGSIRMPATDIPNVGRIAMATDPQGAPFYVMRGAGDEMSMAFAFDKPRPGHCAWNELATVDPEAALAFYGDLFGWVKDSAMDMGPQGVYQTLRHGFLISGVMRKPDVMPVSAWIYYFRVPDIDKAAERITAAGGRVTLKPHAIPGDEFMMHGLDPQGAAFALVGKRV